MKKVNCVQVQKELDELKLGSNYSASAQQHLFMCAACREFEQKQTRLRRIIGSLGTVEAPADFEFRLRARLAEENSSRRFTFLSMMLSHPWTGVATGVSLLTVIAVMLLVGQFFKPHNPPAAVSSNDIERTVPRVAEANPPTKPEIVANNQTEVISRTHGRGLLRRETANAGDRRKRTVVATDFSAEGAYVIREKTFPIDASFQSLSVSVDDGRGNARTISVPTVSFGAQRLLASSNQLTPKGVW